MNTQILYNIEKVTQSNQTTYRSSRFIGPSKLDNPCERMAFMEFRFFSENKAIDIKPGKLMRLFARGQREEEVIIDILKKAGYEVVDEDPKRMHESIKQYKLTFAYGHGMGFVDGFIKMNSTWQPTEFKTYNDSRFKNLVKKGVKESDRAYYGQCQVYTYLADCDYCIFIAINKNDDDIYIETVPLDDVYADNLIKKASELVSNNRIPVRISNDPLSYGCRFCKHNDVCFGQTPISKNCRTCAYGAFGDKGHFYCTIGTEDFLVDPEIQRKGCDSHVQGFEIK